MTQDVIYEQQFINKTSAVNISVQEKKNSKAKL